MNRVTDFKVIMGMAGTDDEDYSANGSNDGPVLRAACLAALQSNNAEVIVKPGNYGFNGACTLVASETAGKILKITFMPGAVIRQLATSSSHANDVINITGDAVATALGFSLEIVQPQIVGNSTGGMGIVITDCYHWKIDSPRIYGFTASGGWGIGLSLSSQAIGGTLINPMLSGCSQSNLDFGGACNANTIIGGWCYAATGAGAAVRLNSAAGNKFLGTVFENSPYNIVLNARSTLFDGCWIEAGATAGVNIGTDFSTVFNACHFTGNPAGLDVDFTANSQDAQLINCFGDDGLKVTFRSGSQRPVITNTRGAGGLSTVTDAGAVSPFVRNNKTFNPDYAYAQGAVTGATTFNRVNGRVITATQSANITATVTNGKAHGDQLELDITTGGFTQTWPANVKLAGAALAMTGRSKVLLEWDAVNSFWVEISRALAVA